MLLCVPQELQPYSLNSGLCLFMAAARDGISPTHIHLFSLIERANFYVTTLPKDSLLLIVSKVFNLTTES